MRHAGLWNGVQTRLQYPISWKETILHRFTGGTDGGQPLGDLVFDKQAASMVRRSKVAYHTVAAASAAGLSISCRTGQSSGRKARFISLPALVMGQFRTVESSSTLPVISMARPSPEVPITSGQFSS